MTPDRFILLAKRAVDPSSDLYGRLTVLEREVIQMAADDAIRERVGYDTVLALLRFDVLAETSDDDIASVLANAEVQVREAVQSYDESGNEVRLPTRNAQIILATRGELL